MPLEVEPYLNVARISEIELFHGYHETQTLYLHHFVRSPFRNTDAADAASPGPFRISLDVVTTYTWKFPFCYFLTSLAHKESFCLGI